MRRWIGPLAFGLIAALAVGYAAIAAIPYGMMKIAMDRLARGGINQMSQGPLATPARQPVVRPSPDLAYSSCPFDLAAGPLEIMVVPVPGRYSSLSIFDAATDVAFVFRLGRLCRESGVRQPDMSLCVSTCRSPGRRTPCSHLKPEQLHGWQSAVQARDRWECSRP